MATADGPTLLAWEEVLPVAFVPGAATASGPAMTDDRVVAHRVAANLRVLHTCEALEERRAERDEELSDAPETARLEKKIDLLIELVGHWVAQSGSRPPPAVVSLDAGGLSWRPAKIRASIESTVAIGDSGTVELYLREGVAEALRLPGRVVAAGADGLVKLEFRGLAEAEVDALERFVFRQHRRTIAGRRRAL